MLLLGINLEAFRNLESVRLSFVGDRIFFLGPNGQERPIFWKRLVCRVVYAPFEKVEWKDWCRRGKRRLNFFFRFCDDFGTEHEILLGFQGKGQKDLELNGEKITKLGDYLGLFPRLHCLPVIFVW